MKVCALFKINLQETPQDCVIRPCCPDILKYCDNLNLDEKPEKGESKEAPRGCSPGESG
jgi:hypothetical protein